MNGNYPAGVSSGHSHFNPPDTEHNHEWEQDDDTYPVIKDGAAIFVEYCTHETVLNTEQGYRETIVTDSIPCEETKEARFEIEYIETTSGERVYPPNAEDQDSWNELDDSVEEAIIATERATMDEDEEVSIEFDPDPDCGHVTVKWGGNTIRYSPTDGMQGTDGKGEWSMGIHELIENIDHEDLEPVILHLEQTKEIGYLNDLPDKSDRNDTKSPDIDCHNCPWSGKADELKSLMGKETCPECNVIIKTANIPDGTN